MSMKMKNIIILIVTAICLTTNIYSQLPYRPYSEFKGDKGAYLKYNLEDRGINFQGKTLGELFGSIELTPVGYERFMTISKIDNRSYMLGLTVFYSKYYNNDFSPLHDSYFTIWWETPFLLDEIKVIEKQYPAEKWVIQHYNYFKDKKIKLLKYKVM